MCIERRSQTTLSRFDVAVVGGGPAGLATAIALRRKGLAVLVVERTGYRSQRVGEHIPPTTKLELVSLGLAEVGASGVYASCPGIRSIWGSYEPTDRDYLFHPHGEGLNLSRPDFDLGLAAVAERLGVRITTEARVAALSRLADAWQLLVIRTIGGLEVRATVVIDATGRAASIAKRLGAKPIVFDRLIGIFGRLPAASPRNHIVTVEAVEHGWWYSAGLADGTVVVTFMTDPELIATSKAARTRNWYDRLKEASMTAVRIAEHPGTIELQIRTARTQRLDEPVGDRWLAVGDAAMSFDPLSSEGISKGLAAGQKAAAVAAALCEGHRFEADGYRDDISTEFAQYLAKHHRYYAVERRWPDALFWRRRLSMRMQV
ncbi:NAD(P)/FAD-dependent oxidoreductase [Bradyrhizobium sp. BRP22]|uniref:NAD(P)/FAD-dependent oxidoreductase n=1 Tax=Bradyrhizobium sp. BRP22 TaxID=2793821 RepID=UPI00201C6C6E|nr:NAD(P)/FAD-dependent oxidoreductase [Bradyrhizobium sp. BRP22]MCA1458771.1 NAD(P)/FAD-dependent oxidoreductase [Bradyrhizobium sp. BRP22]